MRMFSLVKMHLDDLTFLLNILFKLRLHVDISLPSNLQSKLKWPTHLFSTCSSRESRGIGMLKYSKRYIPQENLPMLYGSLIGPQLSYCCPVWGSCGKSALQKLQKLQNRAARIVINSPYDNLALLLIKNSGWCTNCGLMDFETSKMVYKSLNALATEC